MQLRTHNRRARGASRVVAMEGVESRVLLSTYVVTNTNDSGSGSLRQAILDANKTTTADTITFKIGSGAKTITPKSALPAIAQPLVLDATSQPGFAGKPLIELSGSSTGSSANGIKTTGSGITLRGLIINRFGGFGVFLYGQGGNKVVGCWIGTDKNGSAAAGNNHGVFVQSPNNTIGGTTAADRNILAGSKNAGVFFYTSAAHHNTVLGNYVGTDPSGTKALANINAGVQVNGGTDNTIGGSSPGARNVISGNKRDGVLIVTAGAQRNSIVGNYIGTNAAGTGRLGNGWYGVEISQPNNTVGGTTAAARNVISGNSYSGVVLYLSTGTGNKVQGNYIGTDYTGTKDLGNLLAGVEMTNGAKKNTIGGDSSAARNIIAGNDRFGVGIYNGSNSNTVKNNRIGVCAQGRVLLNGQSAVSVSNGSSGNTFSSNFIACVSGYNAIQFNSGGNASTGNSIYEKATAGLKVV